MSCARCVYAFVYGRHFGWFELVDVQHVKSDTHMIMFELWVMHGHGTQLQYSRINAWV